MGKVTLRCSGCGVEIQTTTPGVTGYVPKIISKDGAIYCQRCYRLQHYGVNPDENLARPDYKTMLEKAIKKNNLIIYVVDLFNFESSVVDEAHEAIKNNPVLVIANKRDILPKSVDDDKLKEFVYQNLKKRGVNPVGIIISSAYKNYNLDEIFEAMNSLRHNGDVYIIGASSVGKSSIINAIMKSYKNVSRNMISTSPYPGTTIATIRIPLDNKSEIIDTPGAIIPASYFTRLEKSSLKHLIPKTEIKPTTFQLNSRQAVFFGGIARFEVVEGDKSSYTFYCSNDCDLHRVKLDKAEASFDSLIARQKTKPISNLIPDSGLLVEKEFILPKDQNVDIAILGIGWVKVKGVGQKIVVKTLKNINVVLRDAEI